jgi:hypothetical protein
MNTELISDNFVGGKKKFKINLDSQGIAIFAKLFILFLIFFITVILAIYTMKSPDIYNLIFKQDDPDNNFQDPQFIFKQRWTKIIRFTILFITFIITYNIVFFGLFFLYYLISVDGGDELNKAWILFSTRFFKVIHKSKVINLMYYFKIFVMILLTLFVFFMLYFLWNKSFFNNIYYQNVVDPDADDPKDEMPQPEKYIHYYGLLLIVVMLFIYMIINLDQVLINDTDVFSFLIITVFIIFILLMSGHTIKNMLYRNTKKIFIFSLLGVLLPIIIFNAISIIMMS